MLYSVSQLFIYKTQQQQLKRTFHLEEHVIWNVPAFLAVPFVAALLVIVVSWNDHYSLPVEPFELTHLHAGRFAHVCLVLFSLL